MLSSGAGVARPTDAWRRLGRGSSHHLLVVETVETQATAGDSEPMLSRKSFEAFVAARSPGLLRTAYLLTHDHHLAEDLLQTALSKATREGGASAA